jgi:tripeptidyl-peptidase-2
VVKRIRSERLDQLKLNSQRLESKILEQLHKLPEQSKEQENDEEVPSKKEDLDAQLEILRSWIGYQEDPVQDLVEPGPIFDVLSWYDGHHWRVVVDVQETGQLQTSNGMTSYRHFQEKSIFGEKDHCVYSINVYDAGQIVSIVTLTGSHGTHVAAIAAAHHPTDSSLNGLAPGAQVVSLKIGDTRLGGMETGPGLARAALVMAQHQVDLANISYGEACHTADVGRIVELFRDQVVRRYGVIIVASAGNEGPALSTVGAPGGSTSGIISVGAHVGHAQMAAEYNLIDVSKVPEQEYTWTSRGPTYDGDIGVDIYAPGSAITSVPTYQLAGNQLMNGTSMSSPNACGNLALLISKWKVHYPSKKMSTARLLRALQNTGKPVESCCFGRPFIRICRAWEYLETNSDDSFQDIQFALEVGPKKARGIYLREESETQDVTSISVTVNPEWPLSPARHAWNEYFEDDKEVKGNDLPSPDPANADQISQLNERMLKLDLRLQLVPSQPWIRCPKFSQFTNDGRGFPIELDLNTLSPGLHAGKVEVYDSNHCDIGPLFMVPVTVCKPEPKVPLTSPYALRIEGLRTGPGSIDRRFVSVPIGCTSADVHVRSKLNTSTGSKSMFLVRALQLTPGTRYSATGTTLRYTLGPEPTNFPAKRFSVLQGRTMELCIAQWWSATSTYCVDVDLVFHGIDISPLRLIQPSPLLGDHVSRLEIRNNGRTQSDVAVSLSVDHLRKYFAPSSAKISPLGQRDITPDVKQVYELVLEYKVTVTSANGSVKCTPRFPGVQDVLYDSPYSSYLVQVFNPQKRRIAFQDMYPKEINVPAGDFTVQMQVTHHTVSLLENLKALQLAVDFPTKCSIDLFSSFQGSISKESKWPGKATLESGAVLPIFAVAPSEIKDAKPGDALTGSIMISFGGLTKGNDRGGFPICFSVGQIPSSSKTPSSKPAIKDLSTSVRDAKLSYLRTLTEAKEKKSLADQLVLEYPNVLPVLSAALEVASEHTDKVIQADAILQHVQRSNLSLELTSTKSETKKQAETQRDALVEALLQKSKALIDLESSKQGKKDAGLLEELTPMVNELRQWLNTDLLSIASNSPTHLEVIVKYLMMQDRAGLALKAVSKYLDTVRGDLTKSNAGWTLMKAVISELQWQEWLKVHERASIVRSPSCFAPF